MKRLIIFFSAVVFILSNLIFAQESKSNNSYLKNHHSISFNMGFKGNSKIKATTLPLRTDLTSGFTGGLEYGYWFSDEWQVGFNVSLVEGSFNVNISNVEAHAVTAFLFGFKYYPEGLKLGEVGRVYASLFAGPCVAFVSNTTSIPGTTTSSETVIGGSAGIGVDLFVAKWFKLGPSINYYFSGDFKEIPGGNKNFSGASFNFNFGFVL